MAFFIFINLFLIAGFVILDLFYGHLLNTAKMNNRRLKLIEYKLNESRR